MRVIFFGTPEFAVPSLDAVAAEHEIVAVVAQPDRPAGRGMKMQAPPVAMRARELGLELLQPPKIRDEAVLEKIEAMRADVGVVVAYGKILPARLLAAAPHGFLNVHGSLLPKYRGAAPMQRAIEAGETITGVTIIRLDEEMDHGPMLAMESTAIGPDERLPSVAERLAEIGGRVIASVLRDIDSGTAVERPQDHANATYAAKIEKEEGGITFDEPAATIYNRFRAFDPWPGVFFQSSGETIKIAEMGRGEGSAEPRTILRIDDGVTVAAGGGALRLETLQRPGKSRAAAGDVARGLGWRAGARLP